MTTDDLRAAIRALVAEHAEPPAGDDDPLEIDSLTVVQIVEALEDRFDLRVAPREVTPENFGSIGSVAAFVASKRGGSP